MPRVAPVMSVCPCDSFIAASRRLWSCDAFHASYPGSRCRRNAWCSDCPRMPMNPCANGNGNQTPAAMHAHTRSEEHTSELQSLMRISYSVLCLKKKTEQTVDDTTIMTQTTT